MTGSTISTTINTEVFLGAPGYGSPLTITSGGYLGPTFNTDAALYAGTATAGDRVLNLGTIHGDSGAHEPSRDGFYGVEILGAITLTNFNEIHGGNGGYYSGSGYGGPHAGSGGAGIVMAAAGTILNHGIIHGGNGGYGYAGSVKAGNGGAGVLLERGSVINSDYIIGGEATDFVNTGGTGGTGAVLYSGTTLTNNFVVRGDNTFGDDTITGSTGGIAVYAKAGAKLINNHVIYGGHGGGFTLSGHGGAGGDGVFLLASFSNAGTIEGGAGGGGFGGSGAGTAGAGGAGVYVGAKVSLGNSGTIVGGQAGYAEYGTGGAGGAGVSVAAIGTVVNTAVISGGLGGAGGLANGAGGVGVTLGVGASLTNSGGIFGGTVETTPGTTIASGRGGIGVEGTTGVVLINQGGITGGAQGSGGRGGYGGIGVALGGAATFTNNGTVTGGAADIANINIGGVGGDGLELASGAVATNNGLIAGGVGGGDYFIPSYMFYGGGGAGAFVYGGTLTNAGTILAGGPDPEYGENYSEVAGVDLADAVLINAGTIKGANDNLATGKYGPHKYLGIGAGVDDLLASTVTNTGLIQGGGGGAQNYLALIGGYGAYFKDGGVLSNTGTIAGGAAATTTISYIEVGGHGGGGADLTLVSLHNTGLVGAGAGGYGFQAGGTGGIGLNLVATTVTNTGTIVAGMGGAGYVTGGAGGVGMHGTTIAGATLAANLLTNSGGIRGGAGGSGSNYGGAGGGGVLLQAAATVTNSGTIAAGAGGAGSERGGSGGIGLYMEGGKLANTGHITGGAGMNEGQGGAGLFLFLGSGSNAGTITGGAGGGGTISRTGGYGAYVFDGATLTNTGLIAAGASGSGSKTDGPGATGIRLGVGTLINSGTISGAAGGAGPNGTKGPAGDAVYAYSGGNLIIDNPGAVFNGLVVNTPGYANPLEFAGTSTVAVTGIGTEFTNFSNLSFATGAQRTIEGGTIGLTTGQTIAGFAAHDKIILDSFAATGVGVVSASDIQLIDGSKTVTLDLTGTLARDLIVTNGSNVAAVAVASHTAAVTLNTTSFEMITSGGSASASVITGGGFQVVFAGGTASATKVGSAGHEHVYGKTTGLVVSSGGYVTVYSGGADSNTTIGAGGTLEVQSGGSSPGSIFFTGSGGEFIIDSPYLPPEVISGFVAGNTIKLAAVPYSSTDKVTVKSAGIVTVSAGGKAYNLNISGATVGETDFVFGSGSLLTKTAEQPKMAFLAARPRVAPGGFALPPLAEIAARDFALNVSAAGRPVVEYGVSAHHLAGATLDVLSLVHRGGVETTIPLHLETSLFSG